MTATTIRVQMAQRKDTAANWTAANPILLSGEIGYETDTKKFKIGNGSTNWNSLAYLPIPDGSGNLTITGNLEIGSTGSLTFEGSTADGFETTLAVTNPTADRTITLPDRSGTVITSGDTGTVTSTMLADGTIVNADISATAEIAVSKLANGTANQIITTDGTDVSWSSNLNLAGNATIQGDLTVNGTTTTIDSQTLLVEDKNIEMGVVAAPTDVTADGGGITLRGTTNKTINWIDSTDSWTSSEHVDLTSGKSYRINNTEVLSSTTLGSGVTGSSLTSVGTIGTGVWQGTAISATYLDATLVKTSDTGTVTSTMIANGTIVDADINASAAIADTKLATISTAGKVSNSATTATSANTASAIVARDASGNFTAGTITANLTGTASAIADSSVTDAKVSATAAIAGTKISPDFGSQNVTTTGTSTAASFIPTSSTVPTNGVYLPAANSVAISTGGSGRLFVDASGAVTVPTRFIIGTANNVGGLSETTRTTAGVFNTSRLLDGGTNPYLQTGAEAGIVYFNADGSSVPPIVFRTGGGERLRITSAGLVGVGVSSPSWPLDVNGVARSTGTSAMFALSDRSTGTGDRYGIYSNSNTFRVYDFTAAADRVVVDSSGRVGVGTTGPSQKLQIAAGNVQIDSNYGFIWDNSTTGIYGNGSPSVLQFYTGNAERMRVTSTGVGIGTSSPVATNHIRGSGTSGQVTASWILENASSGAVGMDVTGAAGSSIWRFLYTGSGPQTGTNTFNTALSIGVEGSAAGRVGIGTSSPSSNGLVTIAETTNARLYLTDSTLGNTYGAQLRGYGVGGQGAYAELGVVDNNSYRKGITITQQANAIIFNTLTDERARIDSSGRLLVGTSSASAADATIIAQGNAQNSTFGSRLYLARGEATPADGAGLGHLNFSDSTHTVSAMIRAIRDGGTWSGSSKPTRLEFSTTADGASSPTERMRISNAGLVTAFGATDVMEAGSAAAAGTTSFLFYGVSGRTALGTGGNIEFRVASNGNVTNTNNSYGSLSDIKLKENIVDANSQWDDIKALQVRNYNFKEGQTHTQIGLVAQEVELVSPGLVSESPDRDAEGNDLGTVTKSVNYSVLYMKAVKALQEAMERIETLEAKVAALEPKP